MDEDDLYSHLMYPQVFAEFVDFRKKFDDLSGLPTPAFFYGMHVGDEVEVEIDRGKTLFVKLVSIGDADPDGKRTLFYELNGMPRESVIVDKSRVSSGSKAARAKGDPSDTAQACAPMPGMVTEIAVSPGQEVKEGDKLVVLEAMKMLTTVSASQDGVVKDVLVQKGEQVDSDDLLIRLA